MKLNQCKLDLSQCCAFKLTSIHSFLCSLYKKIANKQDRLA